MARFLCAALFVLLAASQAAAWNSAPGCTDKVTGYSPFFGNKGENKPMTYLDHTAQWKKFGQITKINLYYSWNFRCLQGIKATYGYDAKNALKIGIDKKGLTTSDIKLADYEWVTKVEVRQLDSKCINWIKLYTNKGQSLAIGDGKSTSPMQTATINRKAGFLAALRGWEDKEVVEGKTVSGGLQQLQFVWAVEECPKPVESPKPIEVSKPVETPKPSPPPVVKPPVVKPPVVKPPVVKPPVVKPVCPEQPTLCTTDIEFAGKTFCPFINPFTNSVCLGGCCKSAGKCKAPVCSLAGLGADVMTLDFICWGKNNGKFGKLNKCKNLACKLEIKGCTSDLLSGSCLGKVEAVSKDIHPEAARYIGMPCLDKSSMFDMKTMGKKMLPITLMAAKESIKGTHAASLWTVCDCNAQNPLIPTLPDLSLENLLGPNCKGPLCALIPQLKIFGISLKDLQVPLTTLGQLSKLLSPEPLALNITQLVDIIQLPELPKITIPNIQMTDLIQPSLPKFPTAKDVLEVVTQFTDGLKPVVDALTEQQEDIQAAITKTAGDGVSAALKVLENIPSLSLPFQLPELDLSKINLDLPQLPKLDLSHLATIADAMGDISPEEVTAQVAKGLKAVLEAVSGGDDKKKAP